MAVRDKNLNDKHLKIKGIVRKSNIELLRIVAMLMIILHHLVIKGADTCGYLTPYNISDGLLGEVINSLIISGVDLFILISGYFGSRNITYNIIRLILDVAIYGLICFAVSMILGTSFSVKNLISSMSIFNNWFVLHFILLLMFSPILESALSNIQIRTLRVWIILLTIVNVIFGWGKGVFNIDGYNVMNFIFIYMLGRYLKLERTVFLPQLRKYPILIYLVSSAMVSCIFVVCYIFIDKHAPATRIFGYNNPFIILSAMCLFCLFEKIKWQKKWINEVAKCAFPVFLLHTGISIQPIRNMFGHEIYAMFGYGGLFLLAVLIYVVCSLIAYPIEKVKSGLYARIKIYVSSLV